MHERGGDDRPWSIVAVANSGYPCWSRMYTRHRMHREHFVAPPPPLAVLLHASEGHALLDGLSPPILV